MRKYKQGRYILLKPEKYIGDKDKVFYRSSWELKFFKWLENNENVVKWVSEEIYIPYIHPFDDKNKIHRYFPDIYCEMKDINNNIKKYIFEIKPKIQCLEPKKPKRITKKFLEEFRTYKINESKWNSAKDFCKKNDLIFEIITEDDLFKRKK